MKRTALDKGRRRKGINLTIGERHPVDSSAYRSFSYSKGSRWCKLATAAAGGAVSDIVRAQFKDAHLTAGNLSDGVLATTEFSFTATVEGIVDGFRPAYTVTRTKLEAEKATEERYEGLETQKGFWYTWGKDGEKPTGWTQADGAPLMLAKPAGAGWKLMVRKGDGK